MQQHVRFPQRRALRRRRRGLSPQHQKVILVFPKSSSSVPLFGLFNWEKMIKNCHSH